MKFLDKSKNLDEAFQEMKADEELEKRVTDLQALVVELEGEKTALHASWMHIQAEKHDLEDKLKEAKKGCVEWRSHTKEVVKKYRELRAENDYLEHRIEQLERRLNLEIPF